MIQTNPVVSWGPHRLWTWGPGLDNVSSYVKHHADGLRLPRGARITDDAQNAFPNLRLLVLEDKAGISEDQLYALSELRELSITDFPKRIDISAFPKLERLSLRWRTGVVENAAESDLSELRIWNFSSSSGDLSSLPDFRMLRCLKLVDAKIESIAGLSRYNSLEEFELYGAKKLRSLEGLQLKKLSLFSAEKCPALVDVDGLVSCQPLTVVRFHECGDLPSLRFVKSLPKLKSIGFIGTSIIDGDLEPLLGIPDVCFTDRKHYSRRSREFESG